MCKISIGEASNPGLPQSRVRPHFSEDGVENVCSSQMRNHGRYVVPGRHNTRRPSVHASLRDLEAVEKHPRYVVSSVSDESTVTDSTHAVQVEIAVDGAHGSGRIAERAVEVQGRPPIAVDMTLADSDTESAVPQSQAALSNRSEDDVSLRHASEDSDLDGVSVASGEAPAVPEVDVPFEVPEVRDASPAIRNAFRRMDGAHLLETGNCDENGARVHSQSLRQLLKPTFREREGGSCSCSCPACSCRDNFVEDWCQEKLHKRLEMFAGGRWEELLRDSEAQEATAATLWRRRRRGWTMLRIAECPRLSVSCRWVSCLQAERPCPGDECHIATVARPVRRVETDFGQTDFGQR